MAMTSYERELGTLTEKMNRVEGDVSRINANLAQINKTLSEARGGWKAIALVSGVSGTIGALLAKLAPFLIGFPR